MPRTQRPQTPDQDRNAQAPPEGQRLQKILADAGIASRRAAEQLILQGLVSVNGRTVDTLPAFADPQNDRIALRGKPIPTPQRHLYIMLHKPRHTLCTMDDPGGRRTVREIVDHPSAARVVPVGRLDFDTMGLLLLTNDGQLANRLTHPRYGIEKTYRAIIKGSLGPEHIDQLGKGVYLADRRDGRTIGGVRTAPVRIEIVNREPERSHLDITLREGRNREVRRVLARVGCPVKKLTRIRMGPLSLKGLRLGEWRELTTPERNALRASANKAQRRVKANATNDPTMNS